MKTTGGTTQKPLHQVHYHTRKQRQSLSCTELINRHRTHRQSCEDTGSLTHSFTYAIYSMVPLQKYRHCSRSSSFCLSFEALLRSYRAQHFRGGKERRQDGQVQVDRLGPKPGQTDKQTGRRLSGASSEASPSLSVHREERLGEERRALLTQADLFDAARLRAINSSSTAGSTNSTV